jgi:hypothetical protein
MKYAKFTSTGTRIDDYEGDYLDMERQFVRIWRTARNNSETDRIVAAIHLDKGESVREVEK